MQKIESRKTYTDTCSHRKSRVNRPTTVTTNRVSGVGTKSTLRGKSELKPLGPEGGRAEPGLGS